MKLKTRMPPFRVSAIPVAQEQLVEKWKALSSCGQTDWRISCIIGEEIGISPKMVEARLAKLRRDGIIGENPNKQAKRGKGFDLSSFRARLLEEGICDGAIARKASEISGRSVASLKTGISRLVTDGKAPENENNQKEATPGEFRWLLKRCLQLSSIGLTRHSMSHVLACECERTPEAIRRMIWDLERDGLKIKGKNSCKSDEMQMIIVERAAGMKDGKDDSEIADDVARRLGRKRETILLLIYRAVHKGGCPQNPN